MKKGQNIDKTTNKENNDNPEQNNNKSYIETIYDKIEDVMSDDNPSQYFPMNFPKPVINPNDYVYDKKK